MNESDQIMVLLLFVIFSVMIYVIVECINTESDKTNCNQNKTKDNKQCDGAQEMIADIAETIIETYTENDSVGNGDDSCDGCCIDYGDNTSCDCDCLGN